MTSLDDELQLRIDDIRADFRDRLRRGASIGLEWFVAHVLDLEVARLRTLDPSLGHARPDIVFLLCGMSPQPLLVSVLAHQPRRVRLIASRTEAGRHAACEVERCLEELRANGRIDCFVERSVEIAASDPAEAYVELRTAIRGTLREHGVEDLERVRLDITGGKKTMVAAAYLVAAELGIATTYVDSEEYDEEARQPVPCTSILRRLDDPTGAFRLRDLDAARNDVRALDFAGAAQKLHALARALQSSRLRPPVPVERIEDAATRCESLLAWREGRFGSLSVDDPVVEEIKNAWRSETRSNRLKRLAKGHPKALLAFVVDRLAWSRVLAEAQRMDAFLRAYSALEVALDGYVEFQLRREFADEKLRDWRDLDLFLRERNRSLDDFLKEKLGREYETLRSQRVREHRNALVHGIEEFDAEIAAVYLEQAHAVDLLDTMRRALGVKNLVSVDEHEQAIRARLEEVKRLLMA